MSDVIDFIEAKKRLRPPRIISFFIPGDLPFGNYWGEQMVEKAIKKLIDQQITEKPNDGDR